MATKRTVKVELVAEVQGFAAGMARAKQSTKDLQGEALKNEQAFNELGVAATAVGIAAGAGVAFAVKKFADFDQAMSYVQAATHETAGNMDLLREAALDAGASTVFSAKESANAIEELAKAGVSTKDILGGGLAGALDLAAAGGLGVAEAAQIAATELTVFGLKGKDMSHVADLLSAAAGKAQGNVTDLGMALKYVGPVAAGMGVSIEETTGVLAAFASQGILAEQAGTSLRGMLMALTSPSAVAKKKIEELGITLYDEQGNFLGLENAAGELQKALGGMTQQQRDAALGVLFGNQQVSAARVLYKEGAEGVDKWTKAVNDQGYAAETAAIRLDNLSGDLEQLGGAFDTLFIKAGEGANGPLRQVVQAVTGLVTAFGDAPPEIQQTTLLLGGVTAVVGLAGGAFFLAAPKIAAFNAAMATLRVSAPKTVAALKTITIAIGAVAAAAAAGKAIDAGIHDLVSGFADLQGKTRDINEYSDAIRDGDIAINHLGQVLQGTSGFWKDFLHNSQLGGGGLSVLYDEAKKLDEALAAASPEDLARRYKQLVAVGDRVGLTAEDIANRFPEATAAMERNKDATKGATGATEDNADALTALADKAADAKSNVSDLSEAILNFGQGALDVQEAQSQFQQAVDDMSASLEKNGATLDLNTQAGRDNSAALRGIVSSTLGLVSAQATAGATQETLSATMLTGRTAFLAAADAAGLTATQANTLADKYGLIPENVSTAVGVTGVPGVLAGIQKINNAVANMTDGKTIDIWYNEHNVPPGLRPSGAALMGYAGGGILPGAPSSKDNMVIGAASGEFMTNARSAAVPSNRRTLEFINNGGVIPGYAMGGQVTQYVPTGPSGFSGSAASPPAAVNVTITAPAIETQDPRTYAQIIGREFARRVAS